MSGRVKIKIKDKKPKIDVFKIIENRFKNMNELRDLIDMDPRKGLVRIRDGAGFREVVRPAYPPPIMYLTSLFIIYYVLIISQI